MWKNKHAGVSAKKAKKKDTAATKDWSEIRSSYIQNDKVKHGGKVWICRRTHNANIDNAPSLSYRHWKEAPSAPEEDLLMEDNTDNA